MYHYFFKSKLFGMLDEYKQFLVKQAESYSKDITILKRKVEIDSNDESSETANKKTKTENIICMHAKFLK